MKIANAPKHALLVFIRAYQYAISPLLPQACRYVPTCSEYAMGAIDLHGAFRGSVMAIARLLRCHPFVRGGYDPVPLDSRVARTLLSADLPAGQNADKACPELAEGNVRATQNYSCTSH